MAEKRLFFGMEVHAPWPQELPRGRVLDENCRHLTLAFLGTMEYEKIAPLLATVPSPDFKVGPVGTFDQCLFLPARHPHVVSWHIAWTGKEKVGTYHEALKRWLQAHSLPTDSRPFTPHVTIARAPFEPKQWHKQFTPLPMMATSLHLYESVGNLKYLSLWSLELIPPIEPLEHTADLAFIVRGASFSELFLHAQVALAFPCPELLPFLQQPKELQSLDEVIMALNESVSYGDSQIGLPYKAVSFHGKVRRPRHLYEWEMIIDV